MGELQLRQEGEKEDSRAATIGRAAARTTAGGVPKAPKTNEAGRTVKGAHLVHSNRVVARTRPSPTWRPSDTHPQPEPLHRIRPKQDATKDQVLVLQPGVRAALLDGVGKPRRCHMQPERMERMCPSPVVSLLARPQGLEHVCASRCARSQGQCLVLWRSRCGDADRDRDMHVAVSGSEPGVGSRKGQGVQGHEPVGPAVAGLPAVHCAAQR